VKSLNGTFGIATSKISKNKRNSLKKIINKKKKMEHIINKNLNNKEDDILYLLKDV
jgi:hypothetical protein